MTFLALATHSLRANLRHRQGIIGLVILAAGIVPVFFSMKGTLQEILTTGTWDTAEPWVRNALGLSGYLISLLCVVFLGVMLGVGTLTQEKAKGVLEALLAAPVRTWTLWWAKVAACFLPASAVGIPVSLGVLWALNVAAIRPIVGEAILPAPVVLTVMVGVPLLGLGLAALVNLIGLLVANPNLGSLAVVAVVIAVSNVLPRLGLKFADWSFAYAHMIAGIGILLLSLLLGRALLTKQRVILSAKRL